MAKQPRLFDPVGGEFAHATKILSRRGASKLAAYLAQRRGSETPPYKSVPRSPRSIRQTTSKRPGDMPGPRFAKMRSAQLPILRSSSVVQ
ncbi:MAG: hypothetical protein QG602_2321 [Verrucomicrobiota bacterium]|nr:hypothetical protein [Verrucomicrobiota bacterium]